MMKLDAEDENDDYETRGDLSSSFSEEIMGTIASQSPRAAAIASSVSEATWATMFCRCMTCCNCVLLIALTTLVVYGTNQVETLETQVQEDQLAIAALQDEVRQKQEVKIEELHQEVQQEHDLTYLTLAGIFTLLTCLISLFHISLHLQKMNQPIIQRKIIAILWMSPIYSVTSFLTLLYPPMEGYMAIIKDFYESYCIYTFLSFLILVLGRGSRENAVEVLAMHAHHLEQPTRLLSRWYEPPPDTSDIAKANAVITECQIFAMQFVFIRPLTTVMYYVYWAIKNKDDDGTTDESGAGNRFLRWLQEGVAGSNSTEALDLSPSVAPIISPTLVPDDSEFFPTIDPMATLMPVSGDLSEATKAYFKSFDFALAMVVNVSVFFAFTGLLKFYHSVQKDLAWCRPWPKFLTIKGVVFLTFWQGCVILIVTNLNGNNNTEENLDEDPTARGRQIQNILICCEMLFFSLTHWCVFPAEEWEKGYEPPTQVAQPGIGFGDFVSDVGQIYRRRRTGRRRPLRMLPGGKRLSPRVNSGGGGLYHGPAAASQMSATASYEGDEFFEEATAAESASYSSRSHRDDEEEFVIQQRPSSRNSGVYPPQPAMATRLSNFSEEAQYVQRRPSPRGAVNLQPMTATRLSHAGNQDGGDEFVLRRTSPRGGGAMMYQQHPMTATRLSQGGIVVEEEEQESSESYHHEDEDLKIPAGPPSMSMEDFRQARSRFMSDGSSVKADDEDDDGELI